MKNRPRKTLAIHEVIDKANALLAIPEIPVQEKYGITALVEALLHKANQYRGFKFLLDGPWEIGTQNHVTRKYFKDNGL